MHDPVNPAAPKPDATTERAELDALLRHMVKHNRSHLDDLRALAQRYQAAGELRLAAEISESTAAYEHGHEQLAKVVQLLDAHGGE